MGEEGHCRTVTVSQPVPLHPSVAQDGSTCPGDWPARTVIPGNGTDDDCDESVDEGGEIETGASGSGDSDGPGSTPARREGVWLRHGVRWGRSWLWP